MDLMADFKLRDQDDGTVWSPDLTIVAKLMSNYYRSQSEHIIA